MNADTLDKLYDEYVALCNIANSIHNTAPQPQTLQDIVEEIDLIAAKLRKYLARHATALS